MAGVFLALWSLLAQAAIDDGLVGYWSFDACNVRDDSGNRFSGRTIGNPRCVSGVQGSAFEFDGNDFIRIPDVPVTPTRHSYALWFRPAVDLDRDSPRQDLLYADTDAEEIPQRRGRPHITLNHDADGKIGFHPRIMTESGDVVTSNDIESTTDMWRADLWYHEAFTWDGRTFRTYIDGELQQTENLQSGMSFVYEGIVLAIRGDETFAFTGSLDEVRMYDRVITASEVRALADREFFSLTLTAEGEGDGGVQIDPPDIVCQDRCTEDYADGAFVTLTALPDDGSTFVGWDGGGCSGTAPCRVTMDRTRSVRATFDVLAFALTVRTPGNGNGTVTSEPAGIDCDDTCSHRFDPDTVVELTAVAEDDSVFIGWSGSGCEGTDTCTVTMSRNRTVRANFIRLFPLAVTLGGTRDGRVTSEPAGIDCGDDCEAIYESDTRVTLTATPGPTSSFGRWSGGGCSGSDPECRVNVNRARNIEAVFDLLRFRLRVRKTGSGSGRIISEPRGVNCGGDCGQTYDIGTVVTLTATPESNSVFLGWEGGECSGTDTCAVTMTEALTVTARFERLFTLTVAKNRLREADGTVSSTPIGIACGDTCEQPFLNGTTVTLSATPGVNARFVSWQGDACSDEAPTCTVQMDRDRTITATFAPVQFPLHVTKNGTGTGTVSSTPAGVDCGDVCSHPFDIGTAVTLTATPDSDSAFIAWGGACLGATTCTVTMTASNQVTATFERMYPLSLNKIRNGDGDGVVTSSPAGINCGAACQAAFLNQATVTLSAVPDVDTHFVGWGGDTCSGVDPCTVIMTAARTVTATFDNPPPVAVAGVDQIVDEGSIVRLHGALSTDFNAAIERYQWSQLSGPTVVLSNVSASQVTFTAPPVLQDGAVLDFMLEVFDRRGVSSTDRVLVNVLDTNIPPLAEAGADQVVEERTLVTLDGSQSSDLDGTLTHTIWTQVAGVPVLLSDPTAVQPTFMSPIVGLNANFAPGDTLPGFLLLHQPQGSVADVQAQGDYAESQWSVMLTRALTTPDVEGDVQFDLTDPDRVYPFSIAYLDNTGAAPPQAAAAAVMATQDTRPYTLGNARSRADLLAQPETPVDCASFTGPLLVTQPNDPDVVPAMTLRAAYDEINVYLCVVAPDPNGVADELKSLWTFLGSQPTPWEQKPASVNIMGGAPETFDEDRIAIWWNINAQDFNTEGCFALCHNQRMQSRNADGRADLWHWQAARSHPAGFATDERLDPNLVNCPEQPCRQPDTAHLPIAFANQRRVDSTVYPAFITPERPDAALRFLFADQLPPACPSDTCALAMPATLFGDVLQFDLTVIDDGELADTDRVSIAIIESGNRDSDADGIINDIEDLAPNGGDGNGDGVPDRRQARVASLPNLVDGAYITLMSEPGTALVDVRPVANPSPGTVPPGFIFPVGFQAFVVRGLAPGDATTVTLLLPPHVVPETYYKFGATAARPTPHWYAFRSDGITGAEMLNDRVHLHFVDGQLGDDDLVINGEIFDPGAVAVAALSSPAPPVTPITLPPGGAGGGGCTLTPEASMGYHLITRSRRHCHLSELASAGRVTGYAITLARHLRARL